MKLAVACFGVTVVGHVLIVALALSAFYMRMVLRSTDLAVAPILIIVAGSIFQIMAFGVLAAKSNRRGSWLVAALMIVLTACFMFASLSRVVVYEYQLTPEDLAVLLAVAMVSCGALCWIKRRPALG